MSCSTVRLIIYVLTNNMCSDIGNIMRKTSENKFNFTLYKKSYKATSFNKEIYRL